MPFAFDPPTLDALLLTHAHLDHCGRIPALTRAGFTRTDPRDQRDGRPRRDRPARLGEAPGRVRRALEPPPCPQGRRGGRGRGRVGGGAADVETDDETLPERLRNAPPEGRTEIREPLYDEHDVDQAMAQARGCDYGDEVAVTDGVTAVFHDAGHILGSAIIELRVTDGDDDADDRLLGRPRPRPTRRSCATRPRSRTPTTSSSSRRTATASTARTTRRSTSWSTADRRGGRRSTASC